MLPHRASLSRVERQWHPAEPSSWAPVGWFSLVVLAAALTWSLCLPSIPTDLGVAPKPSQVFHLEWFLVATAMGCLILAAARSSWIAGVASVALASLQMLGIADEAAHRLGQTGVVGAETDLLYLVAALQVVVFVSAGVAGLRYSLANRRWAKLTARIERLDQAEVRRRAS
jgi:hypothetical protein